MDREMKVHSEQGKIYGGWIINHKWCQSPYPQKAKEEIMLINNKCIVNAYATRR